MGSLVDSVFISYRHKSDDFASRVRKLAERIRATGVQVEFDQFERQEKSLGDPDEGWARWCKKRTEAKCVLVVKSECWFESASHIDKDPDSIPKEAGGRGVASEASALAARLYSQRQRNDFLRFISLDNDQTVIPPDWPQQRYDIEKNGEFELLLKWISKRLGLPLPGEDTNSVTKTIFIADTDLSQQEKKRRLMTHLNHLGWETITSQIPQKIDPKNLSKTLEKCQAIVALIDDPSIEHIMLDQLNAANEIGIERISFHEVKYRESVILSEYPEELGSLITGDFIEFCDNLVYRIETNWGQSERNIEAVKRPELANNQAFLKVIDCTGERVDPGNQIRDWLEAMEFKQQGGTTRYQNYKDGDHISQHFEKFQCQGFLFIFDESTIEQEEKIEELCDNLLSIQFYQGEIDKQPFVGFLYWPPPGAIDWDKVLPIDSVRFKTMHFNNATAALPELLTQLWSVRS